MRLVHLGDDHLHNKELMKQHRRIGMIASSSESIDVFISTGITIFYKLNFIQDVYKKEYTETKNENDRKIRVIK